MNIVKDFIIFLKKRQHGNANLYIHQKVYSLYFEKYVIHWTSLEIVCLLSDFPTPHCHNLPCADHHCTMSWTLTPVLCMCGQMHDMKIFLMEAVILMYMPSSVVLEVCENMPKYFLRCAVWIKDKWTIESALVHFIQLLSCCSITMQKFAKKQIHRLSFCLLPCVNYYLYMQMK